MRKEDRIKITKKIWVDEMDEHGNWQEMRNFIWQLIYESGMFEGNSSEVIAPKQKRKARNSIQMYEINQMLEIYLWLNIIQALRLHRINHDLQICIDHYACA